MMFPIATAAAGAAAVVLSGASLFNMYEMLTLVRNHNHNKKQILMTAHVPPSDMITKAANWKSIDEALHELQTMNRRDLISLYLDCEHPDINDVAVTHRSEQANDDDWVYDGYLLSNGSVLVRGVFNNF